MLACGEAVGYEYITADDVQGGEYFFLLTVYCYNAILLLVNYGSEDNEEKAKSVECEDRQRAAQEA